MEFIQYSREAFGAPWEHPVGEATVRRSFEPHTDYRPKFIMDVMEEGEKEEYCRYIVEKFSEKREVIKESCMKVERKQKDWKMRTRGKEKKRYSALRVTLLYTHTSIWSHHTRSSYSSVKRVLEKNSNPFPPVIETGSRQLSKVISF